MQKLQAVTFDVGGTLTRGGLRRKLYRSRVLERLRLWGHEVEPGKYQRATEESLEELRKLREQLLELKLEEFCSRFLRRLGIEPSRGLLEELQRIYFECFVQVERASATRVLEELSGNYSLGAISNSMGLARRFLESSRLGKYFKTIVISGEVGYRKPHPLPFRRALEELGVTPEQTVHVGDSLEEDVAGAKGVGMLAVLVSRERLKEEAEPKPDLVVGSLREVPLAVENLSSPQLQELLEALGKRCEFCSSEGVNLYRLDPRASEGDLENFVVLCPPCRLELGRFEAPRPRKRGKYRAIYRKAWLKARSRSSPGAAKRSM